jgi:hypothetical protein
MFFEKQQKNKLLMQLREMNYKTLVVLMWQNFKNIRVRWFLPPASKIE